MKAKCVCGCGQRSANNHHAVYRQELKLWAVGRRGDTIKGKGSRTFDDLAKDERNLVPMTFDCHLAHHNRSRTLPLAKLPDPVFEFAAELMGPAAFDYLRHYYAGDDPRLKALL